MKANLACLLFIQIIACIMHNSVEGFCSKPKSLPFNLEITPDRSQYNDGETINYSCDKGYTQRGPVTATCSKSSFIPAEVPECKVTEPWPTDDVSPLLQMEDLTFIESHRSRRKAGKGKGKSKSKKGKQEPSLDTQESFKCHTGKQTACEPKGSECNTYSSSKNNVEQTMETCDEDVKLCFIYQYGVKGDNVTVNTTVSGCVNNLELDYPHDCYNRSYLKEVDCQGALDLKQLEDSLNTTAFGVQVCFCNRTICNESPDTADRNDATASSFQAKMMLESFLVYLLYWK